MGLPERERSCRRLREIFAEALLGISLGTAHEFPHRISTNVAHCFAGFFLEILQFLFKLKLARIPGLRVGQLIFV